MQAIKNDPSQGVGNRDLQAIFDFILRQKFTRADGEDNERAVKVTIDILTIVSLHIVVVEDRKSGATADRQGSAPPRASFLLDPIPQNRLLT